MDGSATDENSTLWVPNFDKSHHTNMMFDSSEPFKDFYAKQSNGSFAADGEVSDWVKVPYNEAHYGHNPKEGDGTNAAEQYRFVRQGQRHRVGRGAEGCRQERR